MSGSPQLGYVGAISPSRLDLGRYDVQRDARYELIRCDTDAQYAAWARKWGNAALNRILWPGR